jgi:chaperonin GroES
MPTEQQWRDTGDASRSSVSDIKLNLKDIVDSVNVAELLTEEQLNQIGQDCIDGYTMDMASRKEWETRNADAIKLALQVVEKKSFPWVNASNVKFPLVTIAALQFLARVSILTKGRSIAKCDYIGTDPDGTKAHRAKRIGDHLSYQLVEEDTEWIDEDEKAKLSASIIGCAFKKSYYDPIEGTTIAEYVPAANLVVDYFTKNFKKAGRVTHLLDMSENDLQERYRAGTFLKVKDEDKGAAVTTNTLQYASDQAQGVRRPQETEITPFSVIEQHKWLDLDGDGYKEPYIVFVKTSNAQTLRIVARFFDVGDAHRKNDAAVAKYEQMASESKVPEFQQKWKNQAEEYKNAKDNHIVRIDAQQCFTKIPFIPSPDGGFYDLGMGALLGPLNCSVDTIINQIIDKGTMQNLGGGFLGRGVKIKGGQTAFSPGQWMPVDSTGDDLRKNIMPLPVGEASQVLFSLLQMLIQYGERISGATDIMSGVSPGQNTPAETSRNTIEQGMKVFSGIYGRMYRSFKKELQIRYNLNRLFLKSSRKFAELTTGDGALIADSDYWTTPVRVFPAADPATVSEEQRKQKAALVYAVSKENPLVNKYLATKNFFENNEIPETEQFCPDPTGPNALPPPQNPKVELEKAQLQFEQQKHQDEMAIKVVELRAMVSLNEAKIAELSAKAEKETAEANGVDTGHRIALMNAQIAAHRAEQEGIMAALSVLQRHLDQQHDQHIDLENLNNDTANKRGNGGMGEKPVH